MSEEKPSALKDVRKGLGLLFRAAKTAVEKLETRGVEEVVVTSAREVGRAIENVASAIEREVFGKRGDRGSSPTEGPPQRPGSPEHPEKNEASRDDERR